MTIGLIMMAGCNSVQTYCAAQVFYSVGSTRVGFYLDYLHRGYVRAEKPNVTQASYIANIYGVGSCFWVVLMGILIRYKGCLKWQALYFGVPITILGAELMIKFRKPGVNIGYIVMCRIFIAIGGGTMVICEQMTVMAVSSQQHIPACWLWRAYSSTLVVRSALLSPLRCGPGCFPETCTMSAG
ncbi:hypothetical protein BBP40_006511 [Aspergillus hancockii]|nr:hypothetical protein BBP40_006511 [Aspergillus hancockii]